MCDADYMVWNDSRTRFTVRNKYKDLAELLKKDANVNRREWLKVFKKTKVFRQICNGKIREYKEFLQDELMHLDKLFKDEVEEKDKDAKMWLGWAIDRSQMRVDDYRKLISNWEFKKDASLGKVKEKDFDIEGARSYPINELLDGVVQLRSPGREFFKCPLHSETKGQSFCWFKEQNKWWCFSCNIGGDSIDLYQELHGASFKEAINFLT